MKKLSETEKLLRKALEDYEDKKFVAKADNLTVGELLDMWAEEELKTGTLSPFCSIPKTVNQFQSDAVY